MVLSKCLLSGEVLITDVARMSDSILVSGPATVKLLFVRFFALPSLLYSQIVFIHIILHLATT